MTILIMVIIVVLVQTHGERNSDQVASMERRDGLYFGS